MKKRLNLPKIDLAMEQLGINKANIAKSLGVSRSIVTSWFKMEKFPRPDKLLKLGLVTGLPFESLVLKTENEPIVAFRKKGPRKTKEEHIGRAKDMGRMLEKLVPWLPSPSPTEKPVLRKPILNYRYIQDVVSIVRKQIGVKDRDKITYGQLINKFHEFEVVIIPVLWGSRENHENALHIRLPESNTTWIYLNLDSHILDFNFWMAHEYGHILSPSLSLDDGEDFADMFAQSLLFPESAAKIAYRELSVLPNIQLRLQNIFRKADKLLISPITIKMAVESYTKEHDLKPINFGKKFYGANYRFIKGYPTISEIINKGGFCVDEYIDTAETIFGSLFFKVLKRYLSENKHSSGIIQNLLQTTIVDAKEVHAKLAC